MVAWQSMSCLTREKMRQVHNQKAVPIFVAQDFSVSERKMRA